jgi:hypothetical protein
MTEPTSSTSAPSATPGPSLTKGFTFTYSDSGELEVLKILKQLSTTATLELNEPGQFFLTPHQASTYQRLLVAYYGFYLEELGGLTERYNEVWAEVRPTRKSDKHTTIELDATMVGKRLNRLKFRLKYIEKVLSSLRDYLRLSNEEHWQAKTQ